MTKILTICAKCDDRFSASLEIDDDRAKSRNYDGYVLPGVGGGDYIRLSIDIETGQIIDWDPEIVEESLVEHGLLDDEC